MLFYKTFILEVYTIKICSVNSVLEMIHKRVCIHQSIWINSNIFWLRPNTNRSKIFFITKLVVSSLVVRNLLTLSNNKMTYLEGLLVLLYL